MSKQRARNENLDFGIRVGVVTRRDDEVLLVRHEKPGREPYWVLPGGRLEPGETIPECAVRELLEETDLAVEFSRVLFVSEFMREGRHTVDVTVEATVADNSEATLGSDPEVSDGDAPTLKGLAWTPLQDLKDISLLPAWVGKRLADTAHPETYQGVSRDD